MDLGPKDHKIPNPTSTFTAMNNTAFAASNLPYTNRTSTYQPLYEYRRSLTHRYCHLLDIE